MHHCSPSQHRSLSLWANRRLTTSKWLTLAFSMATLLLTTLLYSPIVQATLDDRRQKIDIASDRATLNQNTGAAVYTGNVRITQGSMKIQAAEVQITRQDNGGIVAIIRGAPALFQQRLKENEPPVTATANRIIYDSNSKIVKLRGNAKLDRNGDTITSDAIDVDNGSGKLNAGGKERVKMSFEPPPPPADANE